MNPFKNTIGPATWDALAAKSPDGGLLQSSAWVAFQERLGRRVEFVRIEDSGFRIQALVVEHRLPLGFSYVYSPRGPLLYSSSGDHSNGSESRSTDDKEVLDKLEKYRMIFSTLASEVRRRFPRAIFWRIEPPHSASYKLQAISYKLVKAPYDVQPATTLVIDLTKSEAELLAAMKPKTRYNIGVAERHGVTVRMVEVKPRPSEDFARSDEDWQRFVVLLKQTARRDGFRIHPREYYETMFQTLSPEHLQLFFAEHQGSLLAAALVAFNQIHSQSYKLQATSYKLGGWAYYLHGASSSEQREVMAPYALHWQIMREAKRRGCTRYDLWGVDEQRWPGVTRFKTGFAPNTKPTSFMGAWDVVLRPRLYWLYRIWA